jgi:hypothetical protein
VSPDARPDISVRTVWEGIESMRVKDARHPPFWTPGSRGYQMNCEQDRRGFGSGTWNNVPRSLSALGFHTVDLPFQDSMHRRTNIRTLWNLCSSSCSPRKEHKKWTNTGHTRVRAGGLTNTNNRCPRLCIVSPHPAVKITRSHYPTNESAGGYANPCLAPNHRFASECPAR